MVNPSGNAFVEKQETSVYHLFEGTASPHLHILGKVPKFRFFFRTLINLERVVASGETVQALDVHRECSNCAATFWVMNQFLQVLDAANALAPNVPLQAKIVPGAENSGTNFADGDGKPPTASSMAKMSCAQLGKRILGIDITNCPHCEDPISILAPSEDPSVIVKILTQLGLPTRGPQEAPTSFDASFLPTT